MINNENQSSYPQINFTGKIHLITNDQGLSEIATNLKSAQALGFDTETRASFKKGEVYKVALLQLATEKEAFLIRLHTLTRFELIKSIFEHPQILKVGVAVRDDLNLLQKIFQFSPQNFVELQSLAKQKGLKNMGLRGMTEEILQARLSKRAKISNWETPVLSQEQIMYAATDAWIGLELYKKINGTS